MLSKYYFLNFILRLKIEIIKDNIWKKNHILIVYNKYCDQLKETLMGSVLLKLGLFGDGTSFNDFPVKDICKLMTNYDMCTFRTTRWSPSRPNLR